MLLVQEEDVITSLDDFTKKYRALLASGGSLTDRFELVQDAKLQIVLLETVLEDKAKADTSSGQPAKSVDALASAVGSMTLQPTAPAPSSPPKPTGAPVFSFPTGGATPFQFGSSAGGAGTSGFSAVVAPKITPYGYFEPQAPGYDGCYKVVVVGDGGVGKSSPPVQLHYSSRDLAYVGAFSFVD